MANLKFKCNQCGACCRKISDSGSNHEGLPIFEWEVEKIKKLAEEKKIKLLLKPLDFVLDKKSGFYFCTGYVLIGEPCVFLKKNLCSIHKNRPIICTAFPVAKNPNFLHNIPDMSCFSNCCNFDFTKFLSESLDLKKGKIYKISRKKIIKEYNKTFGKEIMDASFIRDRALNYFDEVMKTLSEKNLIDLKVVKYNKNIKPISFLEFLFERKFISKKDKLNLIKKLYTFK